MDIFYNLSSDQLKPIIILGTVTLVFLIHLALVSSKKLKQYFTREHNNVRWVVFLRLAGLFLFGVIPMIVILIFFHEQLISYGLNFTNIARSALWIAGLACVIVPMSYFATKNQGNLEMYPQVRKQEWGIGLLILSAVTWSLYLMAYEFMFRGFLLFGLIPVIGIWPAITLNLAFYSLMHIPKGMKETIGAIPFGFIICLLTLSTGNLWIAIVSHMSLALSNEWFSLYHQPNMKLVRTK